MQAHRSPACILKHSGTFCMHSGTFFMHSGKFCKHSWTLWNILYAFWNILEHSGKAGPRMVGGGQDFMDFMVDIKRDTIGAQYFLYRLWVHYKLTLALVIKLLSSSGPGQVQIFFWISYVASSWQQNVNRQIVSHPYQIFLDHMLRTIRSLIILSASVHPPTSVSRLLSLTNVDT